MNTHIDGILWCHELSLGCLKRKKKEKKRKKSLLTAGGLSTGGNTRTWYFRPVVMCGWSAAGSLVTGGMSTKHVCVRGHAAAECACTCMASAFGRFSGVGRGFRRSGVDVIMGRVGSRDGGDHGTGSGDGG